MTRNKVLVKDLLEVAQANPSLKIVALFGCTERSISSLFFHGETLVLLTDNSKAPFDGKLINTAVKEEYAEQDKVWDYRASRIEVFFGNWHEYYSMDNFCSEDIKVNEIEVAGNKIQLICG